MDSHEFITIAQDLVADAASALNRQEVEPKDVYVVWSNKTLQNNKALLSTDISDGRYYEATYNGDTGELYLDRYKKEQNSVHKIGGNK